MTKHHIEKWFGTIEKVYYPNGKLQQEIWRDQNWNIIKSMEYWPNGNIRMETIMNPDTSFLTYMSFGYIY